MFIVACDTGHNTFYLYLSPCSSSGFNWTTQHDRAHAFHTRSAANVARRRSYKTKDDKTRIKPVG